MACAAGIHADRYNVGTFRISIENIHTSSRKELNQKFYSRREKFREKSPLYALRIDEARVKRHVPSLSVEIWC